MAAQEAVDPSQAAGAQIPLQSFDIPIFPPQAGRLKALTLTSDIKLDEYQELLSKPYSIPRILPPAIESLTLELFSLGYPAGFLAELATKLPNVKSLVVYSQLLGGISDESQADAVALFKQLTGLRGLHLLDVFARKGFFEALAPFVTYDDGSDSSDGNMGRRGLMFLEMNYTTQHEDEEFLSKVPASELPSLVGPGLVTLAFNVSEANETDDPEDPSNLGQSRVTDVSDTGTNPDVLKKDGVMTFNKTLAPGLVKALTEEGRRPVNLKVLNTTLYTLTFDHLRTILQKHAGLMVVMVTLEVEDAATCRKQLLDILQSTVQKVEQVEVVISPGLQFFMAVSLAE